MVLMMVMALDTLVVLHVRHAGPCAAARLACAPGQHKLPSQGPERGV